MKKGTSKCAQVSVSCMVSFSTMTQVYTVWYGWHLCLKTAKKKVSIFSHNQPFKVLKMKITEFANSKDSYEAAQNEPPHLGIYCFLYVL